MLVYYMTSHRIAAEHILPERRMKLSLFHELNDPFELQPYSLADNELRRINRLLEREYFRQQGVMCFSDNWRSPVMWAHYAEKHSGTCLGFEIPDRDGKPLALQVKYSDDRLKFLLDNGKNLYGIDELFIQTLLCTKASEWSYEREYRCVAGLTDRDKATGFYYVDFGPELQLREVILGARNPTPLHQVARLVRDPHHDVSVFKARPAFQKFEMVRNKSVKMVTVPARCSTTNMSPVSAEAE
jgi:hypothetical protein